MNCSKCGKENNDEAVFCVHCGNRLEKKNLKQRPKKKFNKMIIIVLLLVLVLSGLGIGIGFYQTSATLYLKRFANMLVEQKWKEAYDCLEFFAADREEYIEWAKEQLSQAESYRIEKVDVQGGQKEYMLVLTDKENKEIFSDSITLKKQEIKKLFIFPTWKVEEKNLLVEDVDFVVPDGAEFYLNGEMVARERFKENGDGTVSYEPDYLFPGTYTVKVTKQYYADLEKSILIDSKTVKTGEIALTLDLKPDIVWRKAYYDFLNAVANEDMDTINTYFPETAEAVEALIEAAASDDNTSQDKAVHFSLYYIDDNDMPELLLSYGEYCPAHNGVLFSYRENKIQPIWFEGEDREKSFLINEFDVYIKEKQGLVVGENMTIQVGDDRCIHTYRYDGECMVMKDVVICNSAQLGKEEGNEWIKEDDYDWDNLKSSINGKEVSAKKANKKIGEYLADVECVWNKVADITTENIERALATGMDEEMVREEDNSAESEKQENTDEETSADNGDTYMEDQWCSGYKMLIPEGFQYDSAQDDMTFFKDDREGTTLTWGGCRKEDSYYEKDGFQYYPDGETYFELIEGDDIVYSQVGKDYCCYSYIEEDGTIHYWAYHFDNELTYGFELSYSQENKEYYAPIIEKLAEYITKNKGKEE